VIRRRAAADQKEKIANARPNSTRAAGAGGSSSTMLRLYTDESPGLKVDPVVVLVLSLVFIFSVVALHSTFISMTLSRAIIYARELPLGVGLWMASFGHVGKRGCRCTETV
jgi:preprotein translocase subunit Sec61beta